MPTELRRKGMKKFGSIFLQAYGQTESGPNIAHMPRKAHDVLDKSADEQKVLSSCGQPFMGVHVRIVDEADQDVAEGVVGEIVVQSESVMVGYWKKPVETGQVIVDGWLHTGDMGYYDRKGYIYIVDRKKDMIVTGGENVYPREVEEVLYRHPAVQEAAVIGVPDDVWVERVHAVVVLKEGEKAQETEIIDFCKQQLARYKAPKSVELVAALPKNPQGKILKRELREKYWVGKERRV
jgi:acyl-CoA synthetase (AMP-forming)/AMP-acid ligase II